MQSVDFDQESDVLYVRLADAAVARSVSLDDLRLVDYSADGRVVGVEFIDVSEGVDLHDVPFARKIERIIGDAGLGLRLFA